MERKSWWRGYQNGKEQVNSLLEWERVGRKVIRMGESQLRGRLNGLVIRMEKTKCRGYQNGKGFLEMLVEQERITKK